MAYSKKIFSWLMIIILFCFCLYVLSAYNYLLFHTIVELISIFVAYSLFSLAWNSRDFNPNSYLLFLGLAYIFIGSLDLMHTLTYKGMNLIPGYDANLPTQLWILTRYMESLSLILAALFIHKKINVNMVLLGYGIVSIIGILAVFVRVFPNCYVGGVGLTTFKKVSEYIISIVLLIALYLLYKRRAYFSRDVRWLVYLSIVLTIFSEISFTFYISVYGLSNFVGHMFKLFSFFLIYKALIVTGLKKPYELLFFELKQNEARYRKAQEIGHVGNWEYNIETEAFWGSVEAKRIYGFRKDSELFTTEEVEKCIPERERVHKALIDLVDKKNPYDLEFAIRPKDSDQIRFIYSKAELDYDAWGNRKISGVITDITERKKREDKIEALLKEKEIILREVHHRIKNNMATMESILKIHMKKVKNKETESSLSDAINRLKSMRILYDKLFKTQDLDTVQIKEYLNSLVDEVVEVFPNQDNLIVEKNIQNFTINSKLLFPLGIIINELITNAMKYAFTDNNDNKLMVFAEQDRGHVRIIIEDNGAGLNHDFDLEKSTGFGLQLVKMLVKQLNATLDIKGESGTCFQIEFDME